MQALARARARACVCVCVCRVASVTVCVCAGEAGAYHEATVRDPSALGGCVRRKVAARPHQVRQSNTAELDAWVKLSE